MAKVVKGNGWGGKRPGSGRKRAPGESLEAARRRKESALASLRETELDRRRGDLVDKRLEEKRLFELIRAEREVWLNFAASVAGELAAVLGTDTAKTEIALEQLVRRQLGQMTAGRLLGEPAEVACGA
jgi:hypothetical protein